MENGQPQAPAAATPPEGAQPALLIYVLADGTVGVHPLHDVTRGSEDEAIALARAGLEALENHRQDRRTREIFIETMASMFKDGQKPGLVVVP